ncbi:MAG: hypothetical protein CMI01_08960 [Oceanospirillaceae bacterium]|nr:hypothetical protein [Oceanospirillaceae bacterium]
MKNVFAKGFKGTAFAFAISALSLSGTQAFASSVESAEFGNGAWNWWEQSSQSVQNTQASGQTTNLDALSPEFGQGSWNWWADAQDNTIHAVTVAKNDYSPVEPSPSFGAFAIDWWNKS